jgi:phosphoglycerate dehydrogenase-like enzyme
MGGLPAGMAADVWAGGERLPDSADEVEVVVLPFARFLSQMRDHALLVNAARGSIVDTDALLAELRSGRLRAALDVTDPEPLPAGHPLWSAPGLLLTPHVAGAMTTAVPRVMALVRDQLARYATGEPLLNIVGEQGY